MSLEETIRLIVREEVRAAFRELRPPAPKTEESELCPVVPAAAKFGLHPATIHKWFSTGRLKRYGTGRCTRVDLGELRKRLEEMGAEKRKQPTQADLDEQARKILEGA